MAAEPETGPPARELVELSPVSLEAMVLAEGPRPPIRRPRDVENVPPQLREEGALPKAPEIPEDARCPQWWGLAKEVGWGVGELPHLDVVIYRESRCLPEVHNRKDPNGGSRGLTQINGSWTRWLRERGVVDRVEDLFDPETNLRAALLIYRYGIDRYEFGWGPWGFRYVYPYSE
jgi:hypothetical protein